MNLTQTRALLADLRGDLDAIEEGLRQAEASVREKQIEADELRPAIKALEAREARLAMREGGRPAASMNPPLGPHRDEGESPRLRASRPRSMPVFLRALMADGHRRTVDEIIDASRAEFGDELPKRISFTNRLNELVHSGYLHRVRRGVYELASTEADENPDEPGGPHPGVHLDGEKPPAEELITPRLGHPYGEENVKAASRF